MENLDLIDWRMVGFASLWIIGLAMILTVLGFADYHARTKGDRIRDELRKPSYPIWINLGLTLFCLGLLGSSDAMWQAILWGLLAIVFIVLGISSYRTWRKDRSEKG